MDIKNRTTTGGTVKFGDRKPKKTRWRYMVPSGIDKKRGSEKFGLLNSLS
jgi:hypothetical protein